MKRLLICIMILCMASACLCSCTGAKNGEGTAKPTPTFDVDAAAKASGKRVQDIWDKQKSDNAEGSDNTEGSDNESPEKTYAPVMQESYKETMPKDDLKDAKKLARNYIEDKYNCEVDKCTVADDDDKLYEENMIFGCGNIIVLICKTDAGDKYKVVVARANAEAELKVVTAKEA